MLKIPKGLNKYAPGHVNKRYIKFFLFNTIYVLSIAIDRHTFSSLSRLWERLRWWNIDYENGIRGLGLNPFFTLFWTKVPSEKERLIRSVMDS